MNDTTSRLLERIRQGDPWYVDDQFTHQLQNPAARAVIERRWLRWTEAIGGWAQRSQARNRPLAVLDAGCGDGINLLGLQSILTQLEIPARLVGMDPNPLRLERAAAQFPKVSFVRADATALPFRTGSLDLILCNHVLEHITADVHALAGLRRALSPGGLLILGVPNEGCALARLRNHVLEPGIARSTDHVQFYTRPRLARLVDAAGLRVEAVLGEGFFHPHTLLGPLWAKGSWRAFSRGLAALLPSQCAELICFATKHEEEK